MLLSLPLSSLSLSGTFPLLLISELLLVSLVLTCFLFFYCRKLIKTDKKRQEKINTLLEIEQEHETLFQQQRNKCTSFEEKSRKLSLELKMHQQAAEEKEDALKTLQETHQALEQQCLLLKAEIEMQQNTFSDIEHSRSQTRSSQSIISLAPFSQTASRSNLLSNTVSDNESHNVSSDLFVLAEEQPPVLVNTVHPDAGQRKETDKPGEVSTTDTSIIERSAPELAPKKTGDLTIKDVSTLLDEISAMEEKMGLLDQKN